MNNNILFTRKALRNIAPDLTRKQEDAIIDMYLEASKKFKSRVFELEDKIQAIVDVLNNTGKN
jgi:hypothetical protein